MSTVTISKKEYRELVDKKLRYEYLRHIIEGDIFAPPPTRRRKEVLKAFTGARRYNKKFLKGLEKELEHSLSFVK